MNITVAAFEEILQTHPDDKNFALLRKNLDQYSEGDEVNIDGINIRYLSLLAYCAQHNYLDAARLLLAHGANSNNPGIKAIHCATMYNHPDMIDLLWEYGANLDVTDPDEHTALYLSIHHDKTEAKTCLMSKEINVNKSLSSRTPIIEATVQGDFALIKALMEKGANLSVSEDICWELFDCEKIDHDHTILDIAKYYEHNNIIDYLLAQDMAGDLFIPY